MHDSILTKEPRENLNTKESDVSKQSKDMGVWLVIYQDTDGYVQYYKSPSRTEFVSVLETKIVPKGHILEMFRGSKAISWKTKTAVDLVL